MSESSGKEKSPGSSPKKEWLMRIRALELKMSHEEEKRKDEQVMEYELRKLSLQPEAEKIESIAQRERETE